MAAPPRILALLLAFAGLLASPAQAPAADDQDPRLVRLLGAGWAFLESSALSKAEESFTQALALPDGKGKAEVYYALAALWWERRNGQASYNWLREGLGVRDEQGWLWDPGPDGGWERRIEGRIRYIERNFSSVKLELPGGKPLPPLADPPPADPLLASFGAELARAVNDGYEADARHLYVLLPNGLYWVGDQERVLNSGELEAHRAESWPLAVDRGGSRKRFAQHVSAIERAKQDKEALRERQEAARVKAQRNPAAGRPGRTRDPARPPDGPAVAQKPADQRPVAHRLVTAAMTQDISVDVSQRWVSNSFHASFGVLVPSRRSGLEFDFPDAGFLFRIDDDGELKIRGAERLTERLEADWIVGEAGQPNFIELWFDGSKLKIAVNGVDFRPVVVRRGKDEEPVGEWKIRLSDPESEIQHLWIERLVHKVSRTR